MSTKKLTTKDIDDSYDLKDTTLGISGLTITKYEDKNENKELKTGIKILQTSVEYDRKEKEQIIKATLSNVEVLENGEKVDLITRGINTNKEKSQEIIKDDENRKDYEEALNKTLNEKGEYTDESLLIVRELVERVLAEKGIEAEKILFTTSDREELKGSKKCEKWRSYWKSWFGFKRWRFDV